MNNIEKKLAEEKKRLDLVTAPQELEARLRRALNTSKPKRRNRFFTLGKLAAVALFFMMLVGYNFNAFAYYGKKLLGFDEVISGTLNDLNEKGMGQMIGKKMMLQDGTEFTIDGLMTDANQLILYYTLLNPNGIEEMANFDFRLEKITGFFTNSHVSSGVSSINAAGTEIKGTMHFDPVSPFARKLTIHIWEPSLNGQGTESSLSFPYNPNKAMQTQIKQSIKKTANVDKGYIKFQSITATPTATVIEGTLDVENFDRLPLGLHGIQLIANGEEIEILGSGVKSAIRGSKFYIQFDRLPEQIESLELNVNEFVGYHKLDETIALGSAHDTPYTLNGKDLWITNISRTSKNVEITISTDQDVMLHGVSIGNANEQTSLITTVNQTMVDQENGQITKERTLLFDLMLEPEFLLVEGMHYIKRYNENIEISVD